MEREVERVWGKESERGKEGKKKYLFGWMEEREWGRSLT
jgi:hypothetical protein